MQVFGSIHWQREASILQLRKTLIIAFALALSSSSAWAQCSGQPLSGRICGNPAATTGLPSFATGTSLFDKAFGTATGSILNRGSSTWADTQTPSLGVNGGIGGSITLQGSSTGSATIGVNASAGTTTFNLPVGNGSSGFTLHTDGSGNTSWTSAGAGTVSSVGLSLPGIFTVTNSPVTSSGTLTGTLNTQSANLIWAGPTTGAAATPTFRSLVGPDLPNPSSSSLGGIQSAVGVSHQWINSISTSGVPGLTQPAFSDISGSITPAQCPNPSASTIGCVESLVPVTSKWINTISTSGVPSATQPSFSDISGSLVLGQMPSIGNNSILANNSGGTAVPSALTTSNILDFIATTQGDVLYRNATTWVALPPGSSGQVLTTAGAAANPTWTTVTGTGTVTSVATNNGLTGGPVTTTGTIGLATIATGNVLAYTGGGTGVPVATIPSVILDVIGSATGDILYRAAGGTGWTVLPPGTNGQVLTQGATTPSWANAGSVSNVTIAAGTGIGVTGTCTITTTGTCTIGLTNPVSATLGGTGVASPAVHTIPINAGASAQANTGTGTLGQALVSGGASADPSYKSGTWVLLNTLTASNSATLSDTSSFTSSYNEYELVFENVLPVTNTTVCNLQVHSGGIFQTTGYLAVGWAWIAASSTTLSSGTFLLCGGSTGVLNTGQGISGSIIVNNPSQTSSPKNWIGMFTQVIAGPASYGLTSNGFWNGGNGAIDGFQILFSTGNIASGVIKVYGRL